jgi:ubiquinone/menaquinone biosynthesis C-methylase UbiE
VNDVSSYRELAGWYDAIYDARDKDYGREASALLAVARELGIDPRSVLDVACGTGRHLQALREQVEQWPGSMSRRRC